VKVCLGGVISCFRLEVSDSFLSTVGRVRYEGLDSARLSAASIR